MNERNLAMHALAPSIALQVACWLEHTCGQHQAYRAKAATTQLKIGSIISSTQLQARRHYLPVKLQIICGADARFAIISLAQASRACQV